MNAITIPTTCKLQCAPSEARVTFAASKALPTLQGANMVLSSNFESGQIVLVRVVENPAQKQVRLSDFSFCVPQCGDVLACLVGANASFKIDVVKVPNSASEKWTIINRGGLVGQPVFGLTEKSLVVEYIGTVAKNGEPVKLVDSLPNEYNFQKQLIAVVGTDTTTGKTVTTAKLISEFKQLGLKVGACKLTGICGDDVLAFKGAGADQVADFSDAGLASTVSKEEAINAALKCVSFLQGNDVVVAEFGSTLMGGHPIIEVLKLFNSQQLKVVVCCNDAPGAVGSTVLLGAIGIMPSLFSGIVANSELACKVITERSKVPCVAAAKQLLPSLLVEGVVDVEMC